LILLDSSWILVMNRRESRYYVLCLSTHANMKEPNDRKTGQREPMPTGGNAKYDRNYEGGEYSILDIIRESSCV
jgi:hypothetical protein